MTGTFDSFSQNVRSEFEIRAVALVSKEYGGDATDEHL
jgi:hypothetical protein